MRIPLISSLLEKRSNKISGTKNPAPWFEKIFTGPQSRAGVDVNQYSAMHLTAVYACVRIISETVASLPLKIYRTKDNGGKEERQDHSLYTVLHDAPNEEMTAMTFREMLQAHVLTWGNAYAYIMRDNTNRVTGLYPLMPNKTWPHRDPQTAQIIYWTGLPDGTFRWIPKQDVFHLRGLGFDGMIGYSPIQMAREAIGLGLAAEEFGARFFGQGTHIGGFVQYPESLSDAAYQRLKESVNEQYKGLGKSHLLLLLEEGGSFERMGVSPNEAQFLESRKFQIQEISRIFRVPPHMLADLERATHSNIEHQGIEFVTQTLRPWLVRWEQEIKFKLIKDAEYFAEHSVEGLLRGDIQSRYQAYQIARQGGWMNADEIREKENMNPLPNEKGQIYWQPLNIVEAGTDPQEVQNDEDNNDNGNNDDDDGQRSQCFCGGDHKATEHRTQSSEWEQRSAAARDRLINRHQRNFEDAFKRVARRENNEIKKIANQELNNRSLGDFRDKVDEYYDKDSAFSRYLKRTLLPLVMTFGETVQEEAAQEVGGAVGLSESMERYLDDYTEGAVDYYRISSRDQMQSLARDAVDAGEDPLLKVQERLDGWEETRPQNEARELTRNEANAVAERTWQDEGFTRKKWHALGDETCPYCMAMDGTVVEIGGDFLRGGDEFKPEGAEEPIKRKHGIKRPPLHRGCVCAIIAEN